MTEEQVKALGKIIKGTVLEEIMNVDLAKDVPLSPVKNKDAVVGIMKELEQRFFILAFDKVDFLQKMREEHKENQKVCQKFEELQKQILRISEITKAFIGLRFDSKNLVVRKGFQLEDLQSAFRLVKISEVGMDMNFMEKPN